MSNVIQAEYRFRPLTDEEADKACTKMFQELYEGKSASFDDLMESGRRLVKGFREGSTGFPSERIASAIVEREHKKGKENDSTT